MPASIAPTATSTWLDSRTRFASAGPGHMPVRPHPVPKSTAPASSFLSMPPPAGSLGISWLMRPASFARRQREIVYKRNEEFTHVPWQKLHC